MSKIQSIQPSNRQTLGANKNSNKFAALNPTFKGGASNLEEIVAEYGRKNIEPRIGIKGWLSTATQFLQKNKGELQSQGINAFFTFFLSPIFIAFNPFSREDDKTKQYTALRQPISAINALLVSVPLTMLINQHTEKIASEGAIKDLDLRVCPDKNYLEKIYKKEYNNVKSSQDSLEKFLNTFSSAEDRAKVKHDTKLMFPDMKEEKLNKQVEKGVVELFIKNKQKEAANFYTELLYKDPNLLRANEQVKNRVKNLDSYLRENNLHEVDLKDFMKEHFNIEFIKENGKINLELKEQAFLEKMHKIKAIDFLRKMGFVACDITPEDGKYTTDKFSERNLQEFLSTKRSAPVVEVLQKTHKISKTTAAAEVEALSKFFSRQIQYNVDGELIRNESITLHQLVKTLGIRPESFMEDVKNKKTGAFIEGFAKKLQGLKGIVGTETKDIATQLMKLKTRTLTAKFGGTKQYVGIFFNLFISAIACTTLNWAYPRIVENLFPSLLKKNKKEGGSK